MFDRVAALLGFGDSGSAAPQSDPVALASAALMVSVALADGDFASDEATALRQSMIADFGLSEAEAVHILTDAQQEQADASCLYRFTRVITAELDQDGRQEIVRALWKVALADHVIDSFEDNIIAKISGLLGVIPRDRVRLKQEVQAG